MDGLMEKYLKIHSLKLDIKKSGKKKEIPRYIKRKTG